MTPLERADRAKQLLSDPVLKQAMEEIRMAVVSNIEASAMDDIDTHHQAALTLQLLKQLKTRLQRYIDEQAIDEHKKKQDSFIEKMREKFA